MNNPFLEKRCGNCVHWMTEDCPRESKNAGRRYGPHYKEHACDQLQITRHAQLNALRWEEEHA